MSNLTPYSLESGSDRIGSLNFQLSPTEYVPRLSENASDETFAEIIRHRFADHIATLRDLFLRQFNILCVNTDDHADYHAALGDVKPLNPLCQDICLQARSGNIALTSKESQWIIC